MFVYTGYCMSPSESRVTATLVKDLISRFIEKFTVLVRHHIPRHIYTLLMAYFNETSFCMEMESLGLGTVVYTQHAIENNN